MKGIVCVREASEGREGRGSNCTRQEKEITHSLERGTREQTVVETTGKETQARNERPCRATARNQIKVYGGEVKNDLNPAPSLANTLSFLAAFKSTKGREQRELLFAVVFPVQGASVVQYAGIPTYWHVWILLCEQNFLLTELQNSEGEF